MKIIVTLSKYLASLMVVLLSAGAVYQWRAAAADRADFPAPGKLYEIDGLSMHLDCRGEGAPTVVLEAGLTSGSASWVLVHDKLSEITRVCTYDRPGMDWSEQSAEPLDSPTVARRLHALLAAGGVEGPQIILGMSAGGVFVREYFARYPQQIVGMVLVDSSHEQQGNRLPAVGDDALFGNLLALCSWLQPVGVVRAFDLLDGVQGEFDLPEDARALFRANAYQSHNCAAMAAELEGFAREIRDVDPPAPLGALPLIVLSQGKAPAANEAFGMSLADAQAMAEVWDVLQNELTALSSAGERRIAHASGHVIQLEQPQIVIDAVADMVRRLRVPQEVAVQAK